MAAPKNWIKRSIAGGAWTTLVTEAGATVAAISIANNDAVQNVVSVRLATTGGSPLSTLLPPHTLNAYGADVLHFKALTLSADQQVQIWADLAGVDAVASGAL